MNQATPPPLPQKKFTLPKALFIIWSVLFGLTIYLGVSQNLDAQGLGRLTGQFVGVTLISLLLSWVAWRLSRRADWIKSTVFLVVLLIFSLDQFAGLAARRRTARADALDQVREQARRVNQAQIDQFNESGFISHNTQAVDQLITTLKDSASQGTPVERKVMTGVADYIQKINDGQAKHAEASETMDTAWILQPKTLKSPDEIDALATSVTNFIQVNQNFLTLFTNSAALLSRDLKSKGVPDADIQNAVRSFHTGFKPQIPLVEKIRQQDAEFGQILLGILDLYKTEHGKWKWDEQSELVAFENETSGQRWADLVTKISQIAEEQQQTQSELINTRSKILSRSQQ